MDNIKFIDFHTHKPIHEGDASIMEIISCHINKKHESKFYTIGHHPWWTDELLTENHLTNLKNHLMDEGCLAIGECGLDKLKGANKEIQEAVFLQQIEVANEVGVPLIMHCVRQYDAAISFKKKYGKTPWVVHGFRRNNILAKSLLDAEILLSISPIKYMPDSFISMIDYLPDDGYFIETDSEYSLSIQERYEMVSKIKKKDIFALQNQMKNNLKEIFKWKIAALIG